MKIQYDHQAFTMQRYGGISRYFYELINEIQKIRDAEFHLSLKYTNNDYGKLINGYNQYRNISFEFKGKNKIIELLNKKNTLSLLRRGGFDIFHPTYYDAYFLKIIEEKIPFVITVHDLIHEKFTKHFPQIRSKLKTVNNKELLLQKANRIIAISNATKNDIIEHYRIDEKRIDVIYHASSFKASSIIEISNKKNYILFVGNRDAYKNFSFFLEVVSGFLKNEDLNLICAGGSVFTDEEIAKFKSFGIFEKVIYKKISDDNALINLYQHASLFVFPSLYEGFGIPILEALQLGCPTIASNTSSLPEVGGDAVIYFDPYDKNSLYNAITSVLVDNDMKNIMMNKGLELTKKFTWAESAFLTLNTYKKALEA